MLTAYPPRGMVHPKDSSGTRIERTRHGSIPEGIDLCLHAGLLEFRLCWSLFFELLALIAPPVVDAIPAGGATWAHFAASTLVAFATSDSGAPRLETSTPDTVHTANFPLKLG